MLGGLPVRRIIAIGASQSQGRLVTYHNSIHPLANVFDGYVLVLGLGGMLRTDLGVKVFKVDTETDLLFLGEVAARQPDSDHLRTWEIAGASHVSFSDHARRVGLVARDSLPPYTPWICDIQPALSHVATFQVLNAMYAHISRWISRGTLPPTAPRVDVQSAGPPVVLNRTNGRSFTHISPPSEIVRCGSATKASLRAPDSPTTSTLVAQLENAQAMAAHESPRT
jgi:hypothetical protein